jgi:hypothetical protein
LELQEAAHHQSRADEQHERECHLDDHQQAAQAALPRPPCRAAASLFQCLVQIDLRRLQRGRYAEDDSR